MRTQHHDTTNADNVIGFDPAAKPVNLDSPYERIEWAMAQDATPAQRIVLSRICKGYCRTKGLCDYRISVLAEMAQLTPDHTRMCILALEKKGVLVVKRRHWKPSKARRSSEYYPQFP